MNSNHQTRSLPTIADLKLKLVILRDQVGKRKSLNTEVIPGAANDFLMENLRGFMAAIPSVRTVSPINAESKFVSLWSDAEDTHPKSEIDGHFHRLQNFFDTHNIKVFEVAHAVPAGGTSAGGIVTVQAGLTNRERIPILIHELTHELLHGANRPSFDVLETEAEAVSYLVCASLGIDTFADAVESISALGGGEQALADAEERIVSTAMEILSSLLP